MIPWPGHQKTKLFRGFVLHRTPAFCDWGFNVQRGEDILEKWNKIPAGIDILITHGPPLGKFDVSVRFSLQPIIPRCTSQ